METKNKIELEIDEKDPIFFCRKEKCLVRHALNLEKKNYIGFYYSKRDAAAMKKNIAGKIFNGLRSQSVSMRFQTYKRRIFRNRFSLKTK